MKTVIVEYTPGNVAHLGKDYRDPDRVHRAIQRAIGQHFNAIQKSKPGRRITIRIQQIAVAVIEVRR